jgi:hypothetical protein
MLILAIFATRATGNGDNAERSSRCAIILEETVTENLYAPPKSKVADFGHDGVSPAIWNPNSAANWSLLFSPAFGAYLHMMNWEALGEPGKASVAKVWVWVTLVALAGTTLAGAFLPNSKSLDGLSRIVGVVLLLSWYFSSARSQTQYVKSRYGKDYPRRSWGKPLLLGCLALVGFVVFVFIAELVASVFKRGA